MAQQRSKYTEILYVRVSPAAKRYALQQVPNNHPSFSAFIDALIRRDHKVKLAGYKKVIEREDDRNPPIL